MSAMVTLQFRLRGRSTIIAAGPVERLGRRSAWRYAALGTVFCSPLVVVLGLLETAHSRSDSALADR